MYRLRLLAPTTVPSRRPRLRAARIVSFVCAIALAVFALACGASGATGPGAARPMSEWAGEDADLFDDGIDLGALPPAGIETGTSADPFRADDVNDAKIGARLQRADAVMVGKVIGVASEPVGDRRRYRLELNRDGQTIAGADLDSVTLIVDSASPAFGTIRSQEGLLMGKKLVVYLRRYQGEEGSEPISHFHLSADNAHVRSLIERANTIHKVEGK